MTSVASLKKMASSVNLPNINIGLDEATRVKYRDNLLARLSFFSITQTNDPIPKTNFTFSVYYVLGALASLLYALLDPSCEELTAYHVNRPIDECTSMLATFACRTADFDRETGTGFSRTFDAFTCLEGKNATEETFGAYPPSRCASFQESAFPCRTADYDADAGTGYQETFSPLNCPTDAAGIHNDAYSDAHPPSTCGDIEEATFECRTANYDASNPNLEKANFTSANCPVDGTGTAPVYGWHDASECGNLDETTLTCRRTSGCGSNVAGTVQLDDSSIDISYGGYSGTSTDTCRQCVQGLFFEEAITCRSAYGLCCAPEPGDFSTWGTNYGWLEGQFGVTFDPTSFERSSGGGCPDGSMTTLPSRCVSTGETPCACPSNVATGVSVAKSACAAGVALADYSTCGTACGKTYDANANAWDTGGDPFNSITGAVEADASSSTGITQYTYEECRGTHPTAPVTFAACVGTRDVPVVFDTCEGTVETDVSYAVCDGFVTTCPETAMSVRFSQAFAYAGAWMSVLAFMYNFLGQRELARQVEELQRASAAKDADSDDDKVDADDVSVAKAAVDVREVREGDVSVAIVVREDAKP